MKYPKKIEEYQQRINSFAKLKTEMGAQGVDEKLDEVREFLALKLQEIADLKEAPERANEPNMLKEIETASPKEKTIIQKKLSDKEYLCKLKGAMIGRFAGCALGAPVEGYSLAQIEKLAQTLEMDFPPTDYWKDAFDPYSQRYKVSKAKDFTLGHMHALPPDDDIAYTFLSLLVLETYGKDFTTADVGEAWMKYLTIDCTYTAERIALKNLMVGIPAETAGEVLNHGIELIGASIRCDGFAYVNPLNPKRASEFAYRDAYLSHRRSGVYSAMYFATVIAAAFGTGSIMDALQIGLEYIPEDCEFSRQIRWALTISSDVKDYRTAHKLVSERFAGMDLVHAINNACLTAWGALLGERDFAVGISQTVAMGYDNDCTAATVGSILGAFLGIDAIDEKWYSPWNNTAISYLNGIDRFDINDIINRFYNIRKSFK
ncbi:MAG: ADP-ribosylglycohydrolase family protein [Clostridiales bacterium]|nr:ADP-ribosylglycohydrolase family protein [Clostridiales bacterium]